MRELDDYNITTSYFMARVFLEHWSMQMILNTSNMAKLLQIKAWIPSFVVTIL